MEEHVRGPEAGEPRRVRHPLRFRGVEVRSVERRSPGFVRVTFTGDELDGFVSAGFDDHVKVLFPDASGEIVVPEVTPNGVTWPAGRTAIKRDYTPRSHDPETRTLVIEFALHEAGPATAWARSAAPGDRLVIGGPRGSLIIPTGFDFHLLIGDETALPAISRRLAELPGTTRVIVLIEVDGPDEEIVLPSAAACEIHWCHRAGAQPGSSVVLLDTLRGMPLPEGEGFAWVAGETGVVRAIRAHLVGEREMSPNRVRAAGYWRRGVAESHETITE